MISGEEQAEPTSKDNQTHAYRKAENRLDYWVFGFVVITAVATSFAAWYTRSQWITADDMEKRQLRAYISAMKPVLRCPRCDDPEWKPMPGHTVSLENAMIVPVRNDGQTPAYDIRLYATPITRARDDVIYSNSCRIFPQLPGLVILEDHLPAVNLGASQSGELSDPRTAEDIITGEKDWWYEWCGVVLQ